MRAIGVAELPDLARAGAVAEPKWDGFRAVARHTRDGVELYSRHGRSLAGFFPDVCRVLAGYLPTGVILDGELIVWDAVRGRTSFVDLQRRLRAGRRIGQEAAARPAHLVCFDLLADARGRQLLDQPLSVRRRRLQRLLAAAPPQLPICPQTTDEQQARRWFTEWTAVGVEGLVVKGLASRYLPGNAGSWTKLKVRLTTEMIIGGCTGTISQPGTLLLGRLDEQGRLRYLAQTHPLSAAHRRDLADMLTPMAFQGNAADHPWPMPLPAAWSLNFANRQPLHYLQVEPTVVAEIEADLATGTAGQQRHPARHLRTRPDLLPQHLPLFSAEPQP
jgi:ATP-dependent DNA ligase